MFECFDVQRCNPPWKFTLPRNEIGQYDNGNKLLNGIIRGGRKLTESQHIFDWKFPRSLWGGNSDRTFKTFEFPFLWTFFLYYQIIPLVVSYFAHANAHRHWKFQCSVINYQRYLCIDHNLINLLFHSGSFQALIQYPDMVAAQTAKFVSRYTFIFLCFEIIRSIIHKSEIKLT